ncbi:MAG: hypothetical protein ABSA46_02170 [Thermodesulfovibrionales bacterium]
MNNGLAKTKGMLSLSQRSASQHQVNMHFTKTATSSRYGAMVFKKTSESAFEVKNDVPFLIGDARIHAQSMQSDTTVNLYDLM